MKLTKARLRQIIKEEISEVQPSDEYQVSDPYSGKPTRYSPSGYPYKEAVEVLEEVRKRYPNLVGLITEDHFIQNFAREYDSARYGGGALGYRAALEIFLEILEKAHSS